jgi:hypothetical protein
MISLASRREFLGVAGGTALALCGGRAAARPAKRPRVAAVFTAFTYRSHAHVILENFLEPYLFNGNPSDELAPQACLLECHHPIGRPSMFGHLKLLCSRRRIAGCLAALWLSIRPTDARGGPEEAARAESLFREAKAALARGDYATACPQLAESQRLEPAGGTLLALALCYQGLGKNATAWALFQEAEAVARRQGRADRARIARREAEKLQTGLSFLTVKVRADVDPSVEVFLDDLRLGEAAYGVRTAVDVGVHVVEARHGGERYFMETVTLASGETLSVDVRAPTPTLPAADLAPASPSPSALASSAPPAPALRLTKLEPHEPPNAPGLERYVPETVLGAGLASLLAGGYFGLRAWQGSRQLEKECPADPCDPALESVHEGSKRDAALANWLVGLGAASAGVGTYLLIRRARETPHNARSKVVLTASAGKVHIGWARSF